MGARGLVVIQYVFSNSVVVSFVKYFNVNTFNRNTDEVTLRLELDTTDTVKVLNFFP